MKKILFLVILVMVSCKPKQILAESQATGNEISSKEIIQKHYNNTVDFSTLYIKANAKYEDSKNTQNVTAEIRIKNNEKILISVRVLGITMAKALITPDKVYYYEKINNTFFEGNFELLSRWLGTELDYQKVQNLFLGKPIDNLIQHNYKASVENQLYKLKNQQEELIKEFFFEAGNFLLKQQKITHAQKQQQLQINYPEYNKFENTILPLNFSIIATQPKDTINIDINYKNITFNEDLSFPYSVPEGYEQIFIKQ